MEPLEVARCPSRSSVAISRTADSVGNFSPAPEGRKTSMLVGFTRGWHTSTASTASSDASIARPPGLLDICRQRPLETARKSLESRVIVIVSCPEAAEKPPTLRPYIPKIARIPGLVRLTLPGGGGSRAVASPRLPSVQVTVVSVRHARGAEARGGSGLRTKKKIH